MFVFLFQGKHQTISTTVEVILKSDTSEHATFVPSVCMGFVSTNSPKTFLFRLVGDSKLLLGLPRSKS